VCGAFHQCRHGAKGYGTEKSLLFQRRKGREGKGREIRKHLSVMTLASLGVTQSGLLQGKQGHMRSYVIITQGGGGGGGGGGGLRPAGQSTGKIREVTSLDDLRLL